MKDDLIRFTGTSGNAETTLSTAATTAFTGVYVGADRLFMGELRIETMTGTSPTLDVKFQDSVDTSTYADMGLAFPQQTTRHGFIYSSTAATGNEEPVRLAVRTKPGRPYVRVFATPAGTSPVVGGFSVVGVPIERPAF